MVTFFWEFETESIFAFVFWYTSLFACTFFTKGGHLSGGTCPRRASVRGAIVRKGKCPDTSSDTQTHSTVHIIFSHFNSAQYHVYIIVTSILNTNQSLTHATRLYSYFWLLLHQSALFFSSVFSHSGLFLYASLHFLIRNVTHCPQ